MSVAPTLQRYLEDQGVVDYQVVPHAPAGTSSETAEAAHVPGAALAKAVVVETSGGCALVVMPATLHVHLGELRHTLGDTFALATEETVARLFPDCDVGSIPPFGQAYGLGVMVDESLLAQRRVFVQSGDRAALLALAGDDFRRLMQVARAGRYAHPA